MLGRDYDYEIISDHLMLPTEPNKLNYETETKNERKNEIQPNRGKQIEMSFT